MSNEADQAAAEGPEDLDERTLIARSGETTAHVEEPAAVVSETAVDGETVVVARTMLPEETIVVPRAEDGEETIVVPRPESGEETVVVARSAAVADDDAADATRAVPAAAKRGRGRRNSKPSGTVAPPIPEPEGAPSAWLGRSLGFAGGGAGLDPERPIALAPGTNVWDHLPTGVGGVAQGLPVVYGPRDITQTNFLGGIDEVQRLIGPPPAARPVQVREGREQLPSLQKQAARARVTTLILFAGVLGVSALGLYGIAKLAFGW